VHYFICSNKEREEYVAEIRPLAKKYQEYLHFTTTDVNEYPDVVAIMGFPWGSTKVLSAQQLSNGNIYPYTGGKQLTAQVVETFLGVSLRGGSRPGILEQGSVLSCN